MTPKQTQLLRRKLLLYQFSLNNTINIPRLANIFECSTRTIYRDLQAINNALQDIPPKAKQITNNSLFPEDSQ